jgi:hypothetical protein
MRLEEVQWVQCLLCILCYLQALLWENQTHVGEKVQMEVLPQLQGLPQKCKGCHNCPMKSKA